MIKINLGEMNKMAHSIQAEQFTESIKHEMDEKIAVSSNEVAKREMATELMLQGFSEEAICRILNLAPDQLPEATQS